MLMLLGILIAGTILSVMGRRSDGINRVVFSQFVALSKIALRVFISVNIYLWLSGWYFVIFALCACFSHLTCVVTCYAERPEPNCLEIDTTVFDSLGMNAKSVYHAMQLPEDPVLVRWGWGG